MPCHGLTGTLFGKSFPCQNGRKHAYLNDYICKHPKLQFKKAYFKFLPPPLFVFQLRAHDDFQFFVKNLDKMREILPNIDWDFIWISFCAGVPNSIESELAVFG